MAAKKKPAAKPAQTTVAARHAREAEREAAAKVERARIISEAQGK